jgi:hypothetical protein
MHCIGHDYVARGESITSGALSNLPVPTDVTSVNQGSAIQLTGWLDMRPAHGAISIDRANVEVDAVLTAPVRLWGFAGRWRALVTLNDGNDINVNDGFEVGVNLLGYTALLLTSPAVTGEIVWTFTPVRYA